MTEVASSCAVAAGLEPATGSRPARDGFAQLLDLPATALRAAHPQAEGESAARVVELPTHAEVAVPMRLIATGRLAYRAEADAAETAPSVRLAGAGSACAATQAGGPPPAPRARVAGGAEATVARAPQLLWADRAEPSRGGTAALRASQEAAVVSAPVAPGARYLRRRLQAIATTSGLRVLVRDFGLGLRDGAALVAALVARLRDQPVHQVIFNGATVWRDAAPRGAPQE